MRTSASEERTVSRCPRCLLPRAGNPDGSLSFAAPCEECGYEFIPERPPELHAWVCPYCMKQYPGPHGHHVAGDDCATSCSHQRPGGRRVTQPPLVKIAVAPVESFDPKPLPESS